MKKQFSACLLAGCMLLTGIPRIAHAQRDSVAPSNDIATGHSYVGIDLGITGSDYLGAHNFLWGIQTASNLATYLPFDNLGSGIGVVAGAKVGFALGHNFDLETKFRFLTNYSTRQETHPGLILDPVYPNDQSVATDNYSLRLSSLDAALLGHVRLTDQFYAIGGFSASDLIKNGFSASQHLAGTYLRLDTHTNSFISDQQQPETQLDNWFFSYRVDAQIGMGTVYRIGTSNILLDAELLVGIPLTPWLTKVADSSVNGTAKFWFPSSPPPITDPHLWYATLTVGLRLPFEKLPMPIPEPVIPSIESHSEIQQSPPPLLDTGAMVLFGQVIDAATGKPLAATLTTVDLSNNNVVDTAHTESNGRYRVHVTEHPGKYSVTANAPGYLFGTAYFEVDSAGRILNNPQDITLSNSSNGKTRLLVFFDFDKADLQPASAPELNRAVDLMMNVSTMKVEIAGYSDSIGALPHNLDLSLRRADAVRNFLTQHGIAPNRITAHGYGPASPIATNETEEGRAKNRRVEFVVKQ